MLYTACELPVLELAAIAPQVLSRLTRTSVLLWRGRCGVLLLVGVSPVAISRAASAYKNRTRSISANYLDMHGEIHESHCWRAAGFKDIDAGISRLRVACDYKGR